MGSFPLSHPLTSGRNTPTNLPDIFCPANVGNRFFGQEGTKHNKKIQDASTYLVPETSTTLKWLLDDSKLWPCWNFSCSNMQHVNLSWTWFKLGWYVNNISCWINKQLSWLPKITTTETVENVETLHMFPAELVIDNCTLKNRYKLRELNQTWHRSVHWTFVRQQIIIIIIIIIIMILLLLAVIGMVHTPFLETPTGPTRNDWICCFYRGKANSTLKFHHFK